jgi:hypothetical protein
LRGRAREEAAKWFAMAESIRHGGMPSRADLTALAASYAVGRQIRIVHQPLISPVPITLRYTHLAREPLLAALVQFTDSLGSNSERRDVKIVLRQIWSRATQRKHAGI